MDECHICYQQREKLSLLECMHSLCVNCLKKLEHKICPFCRTVISLEVFEKHTRDENKVVHAHPRSQNVRPTPSDLSIGNDSHGDPIRIRFRKCKKVKSYSEVIQTPDGMMIIFEIRGDRSKKGKERNGKGKWGIRNARNTLRV